MPRVASRCAVLRGIDVQEKYGGGGGGEASFDKLFPGTEKLKSSRYGFLHIQMLVEHLFVIKRSKKQELVYEGPSSFFMILKYS